jgi:hypothetical protein
MEYMFLINIDETQTVPSSPAEEGFEEMMSAWFAYNKMLIDTGHFVAGASLQPSSTATVVNNAFGTTTDGPYTETKEQVGGYYVVSAKNLDEALELARQIPAPVPVEVRPLRFRPDAETGSHPTD